MPSTSSVEEDDLETAIARCEEVLATFPSTSRNWETRMTSLTSSWDSARKQLIEAVLTCEGLPSPDHCSICLEGKVCIRCIECPIQFMCSSCDEKVHNCLPFHDRDAYVNGYFHAIPPTVGVDEEDCTQIIAKSFPVPNIPDHCSSCKETGFIKQLPSPGFLIIVNEKGRFDLNNTIIQCSNCKSIIPSWSLMSDVVQAGYWPGSPTDTSYVFDQQLFKLWDSIQKRMPGTSESSFIRALEDVSVMKGRAPTINHSTFSRSFKEWKFCQFEVDHLQGHNWMKCPTCSIFQHSCHVDGNMKLYRYCSSGGQRRQSYYEDVFVANKGDVDSHMKKVYARQSKSKEKDNMCGESHWRAASNKGRKTAKLDETGLEIAGCRHGLAQWAVNMYQGELYGYANYIHVKKMIPAGVAYFWEDIVCKYWKWAKKAGGVEGSGMKPALSVMHAKAHNWTCQVIWGGRLQEGSACSTGEEVEQINSYMSRCGNTTKYMLPENREELITEHALTWNRRKINGMVQSLSRRYTRAVKMKAESLREFDDVLNTYNVSLDDFKSDDWKNTVLNHAHEVEALQGNGNSMQRIQDDIEMLVSAIEQTTHSMSRLADSSKQRAHLRKKISSNKTKLSSLIEKFNEEIAKKEVSHLQASVPEVMKGNFPWGNTTATPIRIKKVIVEKHEMTKRWDEEIALLRKEMANFVAFYMEVTIPQLERTVVELQDKLDNPRCSSDVPLDNEEALLQPEMEQKERKYRTSSMSAAVLQGKLSCAKKGIAFCKNQLCSAATKFKAALAGSDYEECLNINDGSENDGDGDDDDGFDDVNYDSTGDCSDDEFANNNVPTVQDNVEVLGEEIPHRDTFSWKFPVEISQSTLDGRNGSSACSVIALIFAHEVWHGRLNLQRTPSLSPLWVMLLCSSIKVGNRLYDCCRQSLPQRFLSASEAATVAEQCVSVTVHSPLAVRVRDDHAPTTLVYQLSALCDGTQGNAALLIANEKTVLFLALADQSIALVDTHRHGAYGAEILLGRQRNLHQFVGACQKVLDLNDDTYGNLSFIAF